VRTVHAALAAFVEIDTAGRMTTLAIFPDRLVSAFGTVFQMDAVPTCVTEGPDGALWSANSPEFHFRSAARTSIARRRAEALQKYSPVALAGS